MNRKDQQTAFSLVEVIVATLIVGGGVLAMLGVLVDLRGNSTRAELVRVALRLPDAITEGLEAEARRQGLDAIAAKVPVMPTAADGLQMVAMRDGSQLRVWHENETPPLDQYFHVSLRRFAAAPLSLRSPAAHLVLHVRVTWPYRVLAPGGLTEPTAASGRQGIEFNVVIHR